jgi:hypothetical protein
MPDTAAADTFTSRVSVGGLLNGEKIGLIAVILDNFDRFCKHYRARTNQGEDEEDDRSLIVSESGRVEKKSRAKQLAKLSLRYRCESVSVSSE